MLGKGKIKIIHEKLHNEGADISIFEIFDLYYVVLNCEKLTKDFLKSLKMSSNLKKLTRKIKKRTKSILLN